ncbi:hypothetical protein [Streptomyces sp. NPDC013455]|uniref:hypothetical protein n=1 Tax=Streptomyces sp. NPDC013455 TaxID=3155605 RepID=UPI0033EE5B16
MNVNEELLLELAQSLLEVFRVSRGALHGIFQGSHEAALFEAQGGVIGPGGFNHLGSVLQTAQAIETRRDAAILALNRIQGVEPALGVRVRALVEPVLRLSGDYLRIARETGDAAAVLRQTDPTRFQGVVLGQGGLGPEIGRTQAALVTNQINAMAAQLTARGIEPRLIPSSQPALQSVLTSIRQLPLDGRDAVAKLAGVLSSMRLLFSQSLARASLIGRARLTAAILSIEGALVEIGSRLTTPIIIINGSEMRRLMGIPDLSS